MPGQRVALDAAENDSLHNLDYIKKGMDGIIGEKRQLSKLLDWIIDKRQFRTEDAKLSHRQGRLERPGIFLIVIAHNDRCAPCSDQVT